MNEAYKRAYVAQLVETARRGVKAYTCPRCGAECLRGEDHDRCAIVATVVVEPIDRLAEALALVVQGRATYDISPYKGGFALHYRETWQSDRDERRYPVVADHVC